MEAGHQDHLREGRRPGKHGITEQSALEGTSGDHLTQPPTQAGSPGAGTHPGGFGMPPERETLCPPCAACPRALHLQWEEVLPHVEVKVLWFILYMVCATPAHV